jgi:hypothetical protein
MKRSNWKAIAEFMGISAIVISLIFVGYQLKQDQQFALAEMLHDWLESRTEFYAEVRQYAEVLAKGNSGAELSPAEAIILQNLVRSAHDLAYHTQRQHEIVMGWPSGTGTPERELAAFLYQNPAARKAWFEITAEREALVDTLRTPSSLKQTREVGTAAFRVRVNDYLKKLDDLHTSS